MHSATTCEVLNRLWIIHHYSLPNYLAYAPPCWTDDDGAAVRLLHDIVIGQQKLADRIGKMIVDYGGELSPGKFPDRFTTMHDLSSRFMWNELVEYQQRTIDAIEEIIPRLPRASIAQALAQECLGAAKAHVDCIHEIATERARRSA